MIIGQTAVNKRFCADGPARRLSDGTWEELADWLFKLLLVVAVVRQSKVSSETRQ